MNLFSCWFGHPHRFRTRNGKGELVLQCVDCDDQVPLLQSEVIRGPAHDQRDVLGKPETRTFTHAERSKIRQIRRN